MKNVEEKAKPRPLLVDSMLGSTARKLRMFGYNTLYFRSMDDGELLRLGRSRVLITCDKELFKRALEKRESVIIIDEKTDFFRLKTIFELLGYRPSLQHTICTTCNGSLKPIQRNFNNIPEEVLNKHRRFYQCSKCGKVYWSGSQWKKISRFAYRLRHAVDN